MPSSLLPTSGTHLFGPLSAQGLDQIRHSDCRRRSQRPPSVVGGRYQSPRPLRRVRHHLRRERSRKRCRVLHWYGWTHAEHRCLHLRRERVVRTQRVERLSTTTFSFWDSFLHILSLDSSENACSALPHTLTSHCRRKRVSSRRVASQVSLSWPLASRCRLPWTGAEADTLTASRRNT